MRIALICLLVYLVVGLVLNYGSIFIVFGICLRMCKGDMALYDDAVKHNLHKGFGLFDRFAPNIRPLMVFLLWPANVYDTLRIGIGAIREVKTSRHKQTK